MMDSLQKYWDACLIKAWRSDGSVFDAIDFWEHATGLKFMQHENTLKRTPYPGFPWKTRMRVFVAAYLPKISERLWDQPKEKDVAMLERLQSSEYTTLKKAHTTKFETGLSNAHKAIKRAVKRIDFNNDAYQNRNYKTDWKTVK